MIRLYIDKNVLSGLKSPKGINLQRLQEKLNQIKPYVTVVYSGAHISDLKNGYDASDEMIKQKTYEDLVLISKLTGNHCFITTLEKPYIRAGHKDPHIWFEELINEPVETFDVVKVLSEAFDDDTDPIHIEAREKVRDLINSPLNFEAMGINDPSLLKMFGSGKTLGEAMTHMMNFYNEMQNNPDQYKAINQNASKNLNLGTHISAIRENIFSSLDKTMAKKYGITVSSMVESTLGYQKKTDQVTNWDRFINALSILEVVGYKVDNLEKGYNNYHNDVMHSFMAAHCDYFITEDDKTYLKAKAVYEKENISTRVCKVDEFLVEIEKHEFEIKNTSDFLDLIYDHCETKFIEHNFCSIDSKKEFMSGLLEKKLFNYFNKVAIINSNEKFELATYKKEEDNYSNFIYFTEIKLLVDQITKALGVDLLNKGYYNENENTEINEGNWKGRTWSALGFYFILDISKDEILPTFTIMQL